MSHAVRMAAADDLLPTREHLTQSMVLTGLFLTAFELLDTAIVERIKDFFTLGLPDTRHYEEEIAKFPGDNRRIQSLAWLQKNGAVDAADVAIVKAVVDQRNELAHELRYFLMGERELDLDLLLRAREVIRKVEVWWFMEVEIPSNPEFDGKEVDASEVYPGPVIMFDLLLHTLFSSTPDSDRDPLRGPV